jgi:hypothetical protein
MQGPAFFDLTIGIVRSGSFGIGTDIALRAGRPLVALKITPLLISRNFVGLTTEVFLIFVGLIIHEFLLIVVFETRQG